MMEQPERPLSPLFIGGPSRSGTMMLSTMLSRHPEIHLRGETHYFDDLRPRLGAGAFSAVTPAQRDDAVTYFRKLAHRPYGKRGDPEKGWLTREALLAEAEKHGPGADAIFMAFCRLHAARLGKNPAIWGEKTPRNVFRVDDIVAAFPAAKVVCMVRDPRATVVSYRDWTQKNIADAVLAQDAEFVAAYAEDHRRKQASYNTVIATAMWRAAVSAAAAAAAKHGPVRVRVLRYEDVVADPQATLSDLCGWLGVDFVPDMLEVDLANSSYGEGRGVGVSASPIDRWRKKLSDREIGIIQGVAGGAMRKHGYEAVPIRLGPLDLPLAYAAAPLAAVRAAVANKARIASLPAYVWRRLRAIMR